METLLLIIQFLTAFGLIVITLLQTTKSEGLSGTIGGKTDSVFKGRKGSEGTTIEKFTTILAIAFLISSLLTAILK